MVPSAPTKQAPIGTPPSLKEDLASASAAWKPGSDSMAKSLGEYIAIGLDQCHIAIYGILKSVYVHGQSEQLFTPLSSRDGANAYRILRD